MKRFDRLISDIVTELKATTLRVEKEIMSLFPECLSYDLLTGHKRYISHDFDTPWDSSGQLFSKGFDDKFEIDHYKKVEDFFEEYTGNSKASYLSGHGLFYETYGENYKEWMTELYRNAHYAVFEKIDVEVLMILANEVFDNDSNDLVGTDFLAHDLIDRIEEFEDYSDCHAENLRIKISEMDLLFVYKLGEKKTKERLRKEKIEMENREKQIELEKSEFNKLWSLLEKKYKLAYQKSFPKRIEMPEFESFKQFLNEHKVQEQERVWIGKYAPISFSNSVAFKLTLKDRS